MFFLSVEVPFCNAIIPLFLFFLKRSRGSRRPDTTLFDPILQEHAVVAFLRGLRVAAARSEKKQTALSATYVPDCSQYCVVYKIVRVSLEQIAESRRPMVH